MELKELAGICCEKKTVVCIVGAGGKTTLLYYLAEQCSAAGKRVLVSTTTHIWMPDHHYAGNRTEVLQYWKDGTYAVTGTPTPEGKLIMPEPSVLTGLLEDADVVLLEADGSKGLPCKVPAPKEPVLLPECNLVIGVMGMSCLGEKMTDCCFRWEQSGQWLGAAPEARMDEELAFRILSSGQGTKKNVGKRDYLVVLNQCDDQMIRKRAGIIAGKLEETGTAQVILTCFR